MWAYAQRSVLDYVLPLKDFRLDVRELWTYPASKIKVQLANPGLSAK